MPVQKLFIFDLDGTLVDSFRNIQKSLNFALTEFGYPNHDLESTKSMVGNGMAKLVERATPKGTSPEKIDQVLSVVKEHYAENPADETHPYDGMVQILETLIKSGHQLSVLTNKPHHLAEVVLKQSKIAEFFHLMIGQREGKPIKPDPTILEDINADSFSKENVWMIGDGVADGEFSKNAEINFIGVSWGNIPKAVLEEFGKVVDTPSELSNEITKIISQ